MKFKKFVQRASIRAAHMIPDALGFAHWPRPESQIFRRLNRFKSNLLRGAKIYLRQRFLIPICIPPVQTIPLLLQLSISMPAACADTDISLTIKRASNSFRAASRWTFLAMPTFLWCRALGAGAGVGG